MCLSVWSLGLASRGGNPCHWRHALRLFTHLLLGCPWWTVLPTLIDMSDSERSWCLQNTYLETIHVTGHGVFPMQSWQWVLISYHYDLLFFPRQSPLFSPPAHHLDVIGEHMTGFTLWCTVCTYWVIIVEGSWWDTQLVLNLLTRSQAW